MLRPRVELLVGGKIFSSWKSVQISRSIERAAGEFSLAVAGGKGTEILPGAACVLRAGPEGEKPEAIVTGFVDDVSVTYDASSHATNLAGRDAAGDLVDCSAVYKSGQWRSRTILQIALDLCKPFDITVAADVDVGKPFADFAIEEGESVFDCLRRAALQRGLLLVSDGLGGVAFTQAGTQGRATPLVLGENLKSVTVSSSLKERFSSYTVKGQAPGTDEAFGASAANVKGEAKDAQVARHRPIILLAEEAGDAADLKKRAEHERSVRIGRSVRYTATLRSWFDGKGILWTPNTIVPVRDILTGADLDMLLLSTAFSLSTSGTEAVLELTLPEAYKLLPAQPKAKTPSLVEGLAA